MDFRTHEKISIASPKLAEFQGPALLMHNDASFTKMDFESIRRIGGSLKQSSSKGRKVGRFGIGFNSVYHLTDLPSFVSGSRYVIFDPHTTNLDVSASNRTFTFLSLSLSLSLSHTHTHQLDEWSITSHNLNLFVNIRINSTR